MNTNNPQNNQHRLNQPKRTDRLAALWDDGRDGTLSAEQRLEFDALLADDEQAALLWQAETQWLESLADPGAASAGESDGQRFASNTVVIWRTQENRPVIGRIEPVGWRRWAASIAAAIALAVGGLWIADSMIPTPTSTRGTLTVNDHTNGIDPTTTSPVSLLVANTQSTGFEAAHPSSIRQKVSDAFAMLNPSNLVSLFDTMPDPKDFVEPLTAQDSF